jgi:CBS domain-containing protein
MKVKQIMSAEPRVCSPQTNLSEAATLMLKGDCGILPIVSDGTLVGVVTDRDLYIALATRDKLPSQMMVGEVAQHPVHTCGPDDDVQTVLDTMKRHRVRRLPVAGFGGAVVGVISLNDIVLASGARKSLSDTQVADTMRTICAHHHPAPTLVTT